MAESAKARAAFEAFWALGPHRMVAALIPEYGHSVERWSHTYRWQDRAKQRMDEQLAANEQLRLAAMAAAEKRLLAEGIELQSLAAQALREKAQQGRIGAVAAIQALALGAKLELRALGLPETITRQEVSGPGGDAVAVDLDPRERLASRIARLAARLPAAGGAGGPDAGGGVQA